MDAIRGLVDSEPPTHFSGQYSKDEYQKQLVNQRAEQIGKAILLGDQNIEATRQMNKQKQNIANACHCKVNLLLN